VKTAILFDSVSTDDNPDEIDILHQISVVKSSLQHFGYEVVEIPFSEDFKTFHKEMRKEKPDFVFNLVESVNGNGSLIHLAPEYLEKVNIPFTGSSSEAIRITSNKLEAKKYMRKGNIPTADWITLSETYFLSEPTGKKFIIKAIWEHASKGMDKDSVVIFKDIEDMRKRINDKQTKEGYEFFAEEFIDGREFNISVIRKDDKPLVLNPAEICFIDFGDNHKIVDFKAKWDMDSIEYESTVVSSEFTEKDNYIINRMEEMTIKCWYLFNIKGYARIDYRIDNDNNIYVLEVNANPCISPDAGFSNACKKSGFEIKDVISWISQDLNR